VQPTPLQHLRNKLSAGLYEKGEYPFSYDVLSLNPPIADTPGAVSDFKYSETKGKIVLPTDSLVKAYLKRQGGGGSKEYYTRPEQRIGLGDVDPFLSRKGPMADAYYFAQRQYEYMQKHHDAELTEEECVKAVEQILQEEEQTERMRSRQIAKTVKSEVAVKGKTEDMHKESDIDMLLAEKETSTNADMEEDGTIPSVLHGNTNALTQMAQWGDRLSQVPYNRWTIGAATALDHWIACSVLGLSEHAWQDVLQRKDRSRSRAQDIITIRHALFPETLRGHDTDAALEVTEKDDLKEDEEFKAKKDAEHSIDELLASLGGDESDDFWKGLEISNDEAAEGKGADEEDFTFWNEGDESFMRMRRELKNWQAKNVEVPYNEWAEQEKKAFNTWLVSYVSAAHSSLGEKDRAAADIDLDETRNAIFQEPYFSEEQDEMMWLALSEDVEAELTLKELLSSRDKLLADGALSQQEYEEWESFTKLPYNEQLRQLRGISALQPIRESDMPEAQVQDFVSNNIELLSDGISMEELVPDLDGAVTAKDLFNLPEDEHRFKFRTTKMVADSGTENNDDKLFRDMGVFHANVANHEEALFEEGELSLERKTKREQQRSHQKP